MKPGIEIRRESMKRNFIKKLACVLTCGLLITSAAPVGTAVEAAKASSLNAAKMTLAVGENFDINVKNKVKGTKYSFDYEKSEGKNYVTLNKTSGVVKAKAPGTVTIICKAVNGKKVKILKCVITVGPKATKVVINNKDGNTTIPVGEKFNFNDTVTPANTANKSTWSISDTSVFKVDANNGWVRALKDGKATLTVKNGNVSDSVEITAAADYSAVQTGVSTIKVTSPAQMKKEDIKVTRSGVAVSLNADSGIVFSADNREAVITTAGRMAEGTYKVELSKDKTLDFTAAAEKVEKINILSDKAALMDNTSNMNKATVGYEVTNQFNENITKRTSVNVSGSHGATIKENGTILFNKGENTVFNINVDIVSVVIIHTETGLTAQKTLTVSDAKAVSEVSIKGIYNEFKKEMNGDTDLQKEDFYLVIDAKDQYGSSMPEAAIGKEVFVNIASGLTKVTTAASKAGGNTFPKSNKVTISGVEYMAIKLDSTDTKTGDIDPGSFTVMVIAPGTGKTAQENIEVKDGIEAVTLSVVPSDIVVAGKENTFTYEATDGYGKPVTSYDVLKRIQISPDGNTALNSIGMRWKEDSATGAAKLIYKAQDVTADTTAVVTFTLKNYKTMPLTFTVRKNAVPAVVTGVDKNDLNKLLGAAAYADMDVALEKIKVEDSYGNTMTADDLAKACLDTTYKVKARRGDDSDTLSATGIQFDIKSALATAKSEPVFTVKYAPAGITKRQTASIVLYIEKDGKEIAGSDFTFKVSLVPSDGLSVYTVDNIKRIYAASPAGAELFGNQYGRAINVNAKKGDLSVKILPGDYNVETPDFLTFNPGDGKLYCNRNEAFEKDVTEMKGEVVVTINATGDSFKKTVVMSNVEPKVASVSLKASQEDITGGQNQVFDIKSLVNRAGLRYTVKDQYDAEAAVMPSGNLGFRMANNADGLTSKWVQIDPTITFSDAEGTGFTISHNGTKDASVTFGSALNSKSIKVTLDFGTVRRTFKIYG